MTNMTTVGVIGVTPSELLDKAGQLSAKTVELENLLHSIGPIADPTSVFAGAAATQYLTVYQEWSAAQTQMIQSLDALATYLKNCVQAMTDVDDQMKAALGVATG